MGVNPMTYVWPHLKYLKFTLAACLGSNYVVTVESKTFSEPPLPLNPSYAKAWIRPIVNGS